MKDHSHERMLIQDRVKAIRSLKDKPTFSQLRDILKIKTDEALKITAQKIMDDARAFSTHIRFDDDIPAYSEEDRQDRGSLITCVSCGTAYDISIEHDCPKQLNAPFEISATLTGPDIDNLTE